MPKIEEYHLWAKLACSYARSVIDECATEINISKEIIWERYFKVNRVRFTLFSDQESLYHLVCISDQRNYFLMKRLIKNTRMLRSGNCTEYAMLAFNYLRKTITTGTNIEMLSIEGGDHVFVVIGRCKDFPAFAKGEDDNAVICDPYSLREENRVYPAGEIRKRLHCFREYSEEDQLWPYKNEEFPFDPAVHKLRPLYQEQAVINVSNSSKSIHAAVQRMNQISETLSDIDDNAAASILKIIDEVILYQQEFDRAVSDNKLENYHVLNVERYLNRRIRKCIYALYNFIGKQILTSRVGEILLLELIQQEHKNNGDEKLADFIFKLVSHMSDAVVCELLTQIASKDMFHCLIYARYDDFFCNEKDLTLLTLILKRRDGDVFNHMISILPAKIIYDCLIKSAEPMDRFLKWIELYPESESIIDNVLTRIIAILNEQEVKLIRAISDVYNAAIMKLVGDKFHLNHD